MPNNFYVEVDCTTTTAFPPAPQINLPFTPYFQSHVGTTDAFEWSYDGKTVHGRLPALVPYNTYAVPRAKIWFRLAAGASGSKISVFAQQG
jgi:hypothetical protein